jgi:hypothetical protein
VARSPRAGKRTEPVHVQHETGPAETRGRSRRCGRAFRGRDAARSRPTGALDGQALAALGAAALQSQAPGSRLHARPKTMRPRSLALLRLVGAFHRSRDHRQVASQYTQTCSQFWPNFGSRRPPLLFPALCAKPPRRRDSHSQAAGIFARLGHLARSSRIANDKCSWKESFGAARAS